MIKIKIPGKLFISGEYSAIRTNGRAIAVPVNRFLNIEISKADKISEVNSSNHQLKFNFKENIKYQTFDIFWQPFIRAVNTSKKYLTDKYKKITNFKINIKSELDYPNIGKIGLGSSGAIIVGTIESILQLHNIKLKPEEIFSLALNAEKNKFINSSFTDLAVCSFRKPIFYQKPAIDQNKNFKIKTLKWPRSIKLLIGYSGIPFKSTPTINKFNNLNDEIRTNFENKVNGLTTDLFNALMDQKNILSTFQIISNLYQNFDQINKIGIFTPQLNKLINCAEIMNLPAKQSGAGGGDCGIVLSDNKNNSKLFNLWEKNQIIPLNLEIVDE